MIEIIERKAVFIDYEPETLIKFLPTFWLVGIDMNRDCCFKNKNYKYLNI